MLALEDRKAGGSARAGGTVVRLAKGRCVRFGELVRLLEANGFRMVKEKGSIRYYGKPDWDRLIRVDYHGSKEVPTGTCHAVLRAAGIERP